MKNLVRHSLKQALIQSLEIFQNFVTLCRTMVEHVAIPDSLKDKTWLWRVWHDFGVDEFPTSVSASYAEAIAWVSISNHVRLRRKAYRYLIPIIEVPDE